MSRCVADFTGSGWVPGRVLVKSAMCFRFHTKKRSISGPATRKGASMRRLRGYSLQSIARIMNLWHAEIFPWHLPFTAVPIPCLLFIRFAGPASLFCEENVYVHSTIRKFYD
jgi:hypothetical protein